MPDTFGYRDTKVTIMDQGSWSDHGPVRPQSFGSPLVIGWVGYWEA